MGAAAYSSPVLVMTIPKSDGTASTSAVTGLTFPLTGSMKATPRLWGVVLFVGSRIVTETQTNFPSGVTATECAVPSGLGILTELGILIVLRMFLVEVSTTTRHGMLLPLTVQASAT